MKQDVVMSILTPFSSKSAKNWEGATQKTELDEGVQGGRSENYYFMLLFEFCTLLTSVEANMYIHFWHQGIQFQGFEKIWHFGFSFKLLFYVRLSRDGTFMTVCKMFSRFDVL